jgi:hypothetical protein
MDAKSEWVYRTVEGKKCWYRGTKVIPKSELRWADSDKPEVRNAQASLVPMASPVEPVILPASINDARHPVVLEVNVNPADTFEARWRGLPR